MIEHETIVVGGGPAGSACAWALKRSGRDVLILDKQQFPRLKLCAGWITPSVLRALGVRPGDYPFGLVRYDALHFHLWGRHVPIPTRQYSVRRIEFDQWLLRRSGAPLVRHEVKRIERVGDGFVIDGEYRCRYLVGAGGTHCPVYRTFFRERLPRSPGAMIVTLEQEFRYEYRDPRCYLWFFEDGLPGYSWYVPKAGGYLNLGIGGKRASLQERGLTIQELWARFVEKLRRKGLVGGNYRPKPRGYVYYLRSADGPVEDDGAFVVGDAAGVATLDMGEGIYPSILSGLRAAEAIARGQPYELRGIPRYSLPKILCPF